MKQITITEQLNGDFFTLYNANVGSILKDFKGFEYATVRESIDDVSGEYGSVYIFSKHGRRVLNISGDLVGVDVFSKRRTLLRSLRQTGIMKLIKFTTADDLQLQFEAEVTKFVAPYNYKVHEFMIELTAPDWRFYSQELKSFDVQQTLIQGGASIPASIPMSIASPVSSESELTNIITNLGDEKTDPVFTLYGPGTGFNVRNSTDDKEFYLDISLIESDVLVIDVKNRTVIKNGTINMYADFDGDFWSLLPGDNEIRFLIDGGKTVNTRLNVTYRDAYNGV